MDYLEAIEKATTILVNILTIWLIVKKLNK